MIIKTNFMTSMLMPLLSMLHIKVWSLMMLPFMIWHATSVDITAGALKG